LFMLYITILSDVGLLSNDMTINEKWFGKDMEGADWV
jgi:hypothetical protein